jgi:uncharacterized membrane-anchored protein YhcB (DUF1043 family)
MKYCPYCAEPLSRPTGLCPYCKKSLDFDLLKEMLETGESSDINNKLRWKIWYKEHSHFIYPFITLIIGFVIGAILLYGYAQLEFVSDKSQLNEKISTLQKTIDQNASDANNAKSELQKQLTEKDQIIATLLEQKDLYSRMIYFTRRLGDNSTLTPNTPEDADYYRRNTLYLIRLFEESETRLDSLNIVDDKSYNLQAVPELLQ